MASNTRKTTRGTKTAQKAPAKGPFDLADIRTLAKMVNQYDLSELELDNGQSRLRIRRELQLGTVVPAPVVQPPVQPSNRPSAAEAAPAAEEQADDGSTLITSPFVGTFYRSPSPDAAPFVEVDHKVKKGQVLCIVEAMKLMNEIEAEADCKILEILVQNSEPVEFGQPLFRVFPVA